MFFVHETHQVIGRRASDFESIYREEVLPGLAHQSGCRLLWYLNHALGSGPAYNAVTITGIVDGTVWERYNIALMEGEHADLVERLDACRHEPDIPFSVKDTPGTEAMFSAFSKYEPSLLTNSLFNELAVGGWVDGLLFAAAAQAGWSRCERPRHLSRTDQRPVRSPRDDLGRNVTAAHLQPGKAKLSGLLVLDGDH